MIRFLFFLLIGYIFFKVIGALLKFFFQSKTTTNPYSKFNSNNEEQKKTIETEFEEIDSRIKKDKNGEANS